jgi:hypothetical protein
VRKRVREWVLSHALNRDGVFAYMRGEREVNSSDCVRGTYFHPAKKQKYQLIVEIWPSDNNQIKTAAVEIHDAGESRRCT